MIVACALGLYAVAAVVVGLAFRAEREAGLDEDADRVIMRHDPALARDLNLRAFE